MRYSGADLRIYPRSATVLNGLGAVALLIVIVVTIATHPRTSFWQVVSIIGVIYLAITIVTVVRPPGVVALGDHLLVRRLGSPVSIPRSELRQVLLRHSRRVIGGESPSASRHVFLVIGKDSAGESVIPLVWCDRWLGRLSAREAETASRQLDSWMHFDSKSEAAPGAA